MGASFVGRAVVMGSAAIFVSVRLVGQIEPRFVLQHAPYALWPIAAGVQLVAGGWALALERFLPSNVRRTPRVEADRDGS